MSNKIKIKQETDDPTINLALDTINLNKQCIIFANSKRSAEKTAENIAKKIKNVSLTELSKKVLHLSTPTKQCERLAKCLKKGTAFHHAGLTTIQRELIEDNFKAGKIKVIASTPTLAAGIDMPAFRTILKDLRRYTFSGLNWIPTLEYLQMAGRAGRPSYDKVGQAIAVANTEEAKQEIENRYIYGEPEDIYSKLAVEPVLRTYVLSLIASDFVRSKEKLMKFFEKTFWAHQYKDMFKLQATIDKMINLLKEWQFITSTKEPSEFQSAYELGDDEQYQATPMGKRVAQLYIDPLTANYIITCLNRAYNINIKAFSFIQMVCHTLEMRPLLRVKAKELPDIQDRHLLYHNSILEEEPTQYDMEYEQFLASLKTAFMLDDWIEESGEGLLLEKYSIRPGEINVKLNNSDWLLYATEEICRILKKQSLLKEISKTRYRLKHGVKEELIPLLNLKGVGRVRARKLHDNKIKNIKDLKKVDISTLAHLIGKKMAINIKEQLGQKIEPIKEKKKKGQISLLDF